MHGNVFCLFFIDMNMLLSGNRGQCSKYDISIAEGDFKGHLEINWEGDPFKVGDNKIIL